MKQYSTQTAAKKIGVSFRTLNRWLAAGTLRPAEFVTMPGGRTLWLWSDADITKGRKLKGQQRPGPKPKRRKQ